MTAMAAAVPAIRLSTSEVQRDHKGIESSCPSCREQPRREASLIQQIAPSQQ